MENPIVNKVADSGLITLDLENFYPAEEIQVFDLAPHLFMGLILKEKEFREAMKNLDWEAYRDQLVAVTCSADAIIPMWAYMLVASYLQPKAKVIFQGTAAEFRKKLFLDKLAALDLSAFDEKKIVIKGCGDLPIGEFAYFEITKLLLPRAKSIFYGEPCSTVPVYKKR